MTVFAHAGHWLASLAYAAPVLVLLGWMGVIRFKDRHARHQDSEPPQVAPGSTDPG